MTIWCWLFGHKFYFKRGGMCYDYTTWEITTFCTRCGKARATGE